MLCPSCHAKRLTIWSEWFGAELLENVPHRWFRYRPLATVPAIIIPTAAVLFQMGFFFWPHSDFNVHLGPVIYADEKEQLKMTARYGARTPLALSRLTYDRERQLIVYVYTNPYDHGEYTEKVTPHELIARLMTHTSDPWGQTTRCFGFYSNHTRRKRKSAPGNRKSGGTEMKIISVLTEDENVSDILGLPIDEASSLPGGGRQISSPRH